MNGKYLVLGLAAAAVIAGAAMYYVQVYAFYVTLPDSTPLTVATEAGARPLTLTRFDGIDATSSPLRFRVCAVLADPSELVGAIPADKPDPLTAPGWFSCFDAATIGGALRRGEARAYLSERNIARGVDRVIAVYPDGRTYGWHQLNGTLE